MSGPGSLYTSVFGGEIDHAPKAELGEFGDLCLRVLRLRVFLPRLTDRTSSSLGDELQEVVGRVVPVVHVRHGGAVQRLGDGWDSGRPRYINVPQ